MVIKLRNFIPLLVVLQVSCSDLKSKVEEADIVGVYSMNISRYGGLYYSPTLYKLYFYKDSVLLFETCSGLRKSEWYLEGDKLYFRQNDTLGEGNAKLYKMDILSDGNLGMRNVRSVLSKDTTVIFYNHFLYKKINSTPPDSLLQQVQVEYSTDEGL